jgi:hypothetical protein
MADETIKTSAKLSEMEGLRLPEPRRLCHPERIDEIFRKPGNESHHGDTGMRGYDLPAVVKFLEIHGAISYHVQLGSGESDRPPCEGQGEIRLQQFDLDAFGNNTFTRTPNLLL